MTLALLAPLLVLAMLVQTKVGPVTVKVTMGGQVTVKLAGLTAAPGNISVSLCTRSQFTARNCPVTKIAVAGQEVVFADMPPGRYCATAYLDQNANGRLDYNVLGIPAEPAAMTGPRSTMPTFDKAAFELGAAPVTVVVTFR